MSTTRAAVCTGLNEPWKTEEIEIDPPGNREVRVKMVWSGMCHSDEHLRDGRHQPDARGARDDGREVDVPGRRGPRGSGHRDRGRDQRDPGGRGRPRRRVLHPLLRHLLLVCLGPPEPVRPRDDDAGRRHDQRRHLPLPPGGREPEPHGAAGDVRRRDGRARELARAHQPVGQHEGGRADQLRDRHRLRLGGRPGQGHARRDRRGGRVRRRGLGGHSGRPHRRRAHHHRRRPGALQARAGQGDRCDAHRAVAARRPDDAPRAHHGPQRRRRHPDAGRAQGRPDRGRVLLRIQGRRGSW